MRIDELLQFVDRDAILRMSDGEVATVHVHVVDREAQDIVVDILESSHPERYQSRSAAYAFAAADIETADVKK